MYRLFETIQVNNQAFRHLSFHNERVNRSRAELFGVHDEWKLEEYLKIPEDLGDGLFRCRMTYSMEIESTEFEAYRPRMITSLKLVHDPLIEYSYKFLDRSEIDRLFLRRGHCDDVLIVKNDLVTDTSYANIVFRDGDTWVTPSFPLLAGTARERLIRSGLIAMKDIRVSDLSNYGKARLINAMLDFDEPLIPDIPIIRIFGE